MTFAVWAARGVLITVFLVAAVTKARDLPGTLKAVKDLGIPDRFASGVATLLPSLELATVGLLGLWPTVGATLALLLLAAFSIALARTLRAGRAPACHCFGRANRPIDRGDLVRNGALGLLAVVVLGFAP